MAARRELVVGLAVAVAFAASGCVPQAPKDGDWRSQGVQALEDVGSAVDTARLVLQLEQQDRLVTHYDVVTLVHAEETADLSVQSFSALQPPAGDGSLDQRVNDLLSTAADLVRTARVRLAQGSVPEELKQELADLAKRLESAEAGLRSGRWRA